MFREVPGQPVLHHQHTEGAAGTAHRHGEQGGERILPGFRAVGEGRVVLRVRQVHHRRGGGAQADNPLTNPQPCTTNGTRVQPLGRRQFQNVAGALDVDGADLAHEFGRDQAHQLRQRRRGPGTQVAEAG